MRKRILLTVLAIGAVAQFFQPDRSVPPIVPANDMLEMTQAPDEIRTLVQGACYDCHSDQSTYPWYASITPLNFWLQDHINEGREKMNFSRWNEPESREEANECWEMLLEGEMPPKNYAFMHGHAQLTEEQRRRLLDWFAATMPTKDETSADREQEDD
jgi:Haem-binding domain